MGWRAPPRNSASGLPARGKPDRTLRNRQDSMRARRSRAFPASSECWQYEQRGQRCCRGRRPARAGQACVPQPRTPARLANSQLNGRQCRRHQSFRRRRSRGRQWSVRSCSALRARDPSHSGLAAGPFRSHAYNRLDCNRIASIAVGRRPTRRPSGPDQVRALVSASSAILAGA
jgi:hypothetical protein